MMLPYTIQSALTTETLSPVRAKSRKKWLIQAFTLLMIILLAAGFPKPQIIAAAFPGTAGVPAEPSSQASFENYLLSTGRPVFSRYHGYRANFDSFKTHDLLIYGEPAGIAGNTFDSAAGYAILGYSYDEIKVANPLFPAKPPGGPSQTTPWDWAYLDMGQSARLSWARLGEREKYMIKSAILFYQGSSYGNMTFNQLSLMEQTTVVLAPPSWHLGFALYTCHKQQSGKAYATFNGLGAGDATVRSWITLQSMPGCDGSFVIDRDLETVDIAYAVSGELVSFHGKAKASDVQNRGAGNASGWISGSGSGPWTRNLTLRVSRKDLGGLSVRQFTLEGYAWLVSNFGDIVLSRASRTITVKAEPAALPFAVDIALEGSIGYFSGQTNAQGSVIPLDPHRFLNYECMKVILDFTRDPLIIECTFNGKTFKINGIVNKRHYEFNLIIPRLPPTVNWNGDRLGPPLDFFVRANARSESAAFIQGSVNDIEITGDIFDIAHYQVS